MTENHARFALEEEESAQGQDLFRAPEYELALEDARDLAYAAGWLPAGVAHEWSNTETERQISSRRQELYAAMRFLESMAARPSGRPDWLSGMVASLAGLDLALKRHVDQVEARDGLFAQVIERAPHLGGRVGSLREEHRRLVSLCQKALDTAATPGDVDVARLRRKVNDVLGRLALHRQRGAELLFDAYNVDLAAGD
jgi:hypothetical protein